MGIIFWIATTLGAAILIFYLARRNKINEEEKETKDEANRQAKERVMRPQKKLHEEEKKRWEDEYWKRHEQGER
jgi:hypothetical protein